MEILQNFYGNFYERKPSNILKRAEVDEIQTEEKQKEIIAIKSIQKDYWIYWTLFVFQIKSKLSLYSATPGSTQHGDWQYHSQPDQLRG